METLPINGAQPPAPTPGTPAPAPVPQPQIPVQAPVYQQPPMQMPGQPPMYQQGGIVAALKSINWVEFGFLVLGTIAIMQIGYYYRYKLIKDKADNKAMQKQIDELENKIAGLKSNQPTKKGADFGINLFSN